VRVIGAGGSGGFALFAGEVALGRWPVIDESTAEPREDRWLATVPSAGRIAPNSKRVAGGAREPDIAYQSHATRNLDRFPIRRDGGSVIVNSKKSFNQTNTPRPGPQPPSRCSDGRAVLARNANVVS
jgi:hypothetical protein